MTTIMNRMDIENGCSKDGASQEEADLCANVPIMDEMMMMVDDTITADAQHNNPAADNIRVRPNSIRVCIAGMLCAVGTVYGTHSLLNSYLPADNSAPRSIGFSFTQEPRRQLTAEPTLAPRSMGFYFKLDSLDDKSVNNDGPH